MASAIRSRGRTEPANIDHLIQISAARHRRMLRGLLSVPPPPSWDSEALGWVGPVKNQASCGSCWDFSGTGVCEIAYNRAGMGGGATQFVLSEEYTLDCGQNGGCNGDDNTNVLDWAKQTGLPLTSEYGPYTSGNGRTGRCSFKNGMTLYKISDWGFADSNGGKGVTSTSDIKSAIMANGCVGAAIAADNAFEAWGDNYPGKNNPFKGSGSRQIDHDIILVGWDDSIGAWKLRNSWGPQWGLNGYMWIVYGANLVGTESVWATLAAPPGPLSWIP